MSKKLLKAIDLSIKQWEGELEEFATGIKHYEENGFCIVYKDACVLCPIADVCDEMGELMRGKSAKKRIPVVLAILTWLHEFREEVTEAKDEH